MPTAKSLKNNTENMTDFIPENHPEVVALLKEKVKEIGQLPIRPVRLAGANEGGSEELFSIYQEVLEKGVISNSLADYVVNALFAMGHSANVLSPWLELAALMDWKREMRFSAGSFAILVGDWEWAEWSIAHQEWNGPGPEHILFPYMIRGEWSAFLDRPGAGFSNVYKTLARAMKRGMPERIDLALKQLIDQKVRDHFSLATTVYMNRHVPTFNHYLGAVLKCVEKSGHDLTNIAKARPEVVGIATLDTKPTGILRELSGYLG